MKKLILAAATLALSTMAFADEGMWMVNLISRALELKMQERGLELSAGEIYNADAEGAALCDAVVSLDFSCTGSFISDEGLVITNHHCAYSDVFGLSTDEKNYLEDGFWAFNRSDEVKIRGKHIQVLKKVIDVTDEAQGLIDEMGSKSVSMGVRKLSWTLEQRYQELYPELQASLGIMWAGSKYYMALYKDYDDVRLVGAPPVSVAAFGGDIDNWEWPQQKGDFALYRVYENGQPLRPSRKLEISTDGLSEGDFTMVIGYPGITRRYSCAPRVELRENVVLPVSNEVRAEYMDILGRWMNSDPSIRLKYSDYYFGLSNSQECNEGEVRCCRRFGVIEEKQAVDRELQEWIDASSERTERWGGLLARIGKIYSDISEIERNCSYFKETIVRGTKLYLPAVRLRSGSKNAKETMKGIYDGIDLRVERDIFRCQAQSFYRNVDRHYWGEFMTSVWESCGGDIDKIMAATWDASIFTDYDSAMAFAADPDSVLGDDPLFRFINEVRITDFNEESKALDGENTLLALNHEYTRVLWAMREDKGVPQYPDANSTLRLSYGVVSGVEPRDGIICDWKSSTAGILEKYDPSVYEYSLPSDWKPLVSGYSGPVNFLTDNDITGGNSGSPVLDSRGRLVGLAFDGNKESLASDASYTPGYNRTVCVDIRYVIYILREYAGMTSILAELGL